MIILTTALHYSESHVRPFVRSLKDSGFKGKIVALVDNCDAARYLKENGAECIRDVDNGYPINTRRFYYYKQFLRGVVESTLICDIRDIIFQTNPEEEMPTEGINVFCEHEAMRIGTCPYNSEWMKFIFGRCKWEEMPIICAGATSGHLVDYCLEMWDALVRLPKKIGLDQAVHNDLVYSGKVKATVWPNETAPVYTVGYIPRETVPISTLGEIRNQAGVPCIIHQYDRHHNLKEGIRWR